VINPGSVYEGTARISREKGKGRTKKNCYGCSPVGQQYGLINLVVSVERQETNAQKSGNILTAAIGGQQGGQNIKEVFNKR